MSGRLQDKVAIVTGGSRGVGLGIARRFLEEGALVATCSRSELDPPPAGEGLDGAKDRCFHMPCDHKDWDQIDALVTRTVETFGRLDILINNAGGSPTSKTAEGSPNFHKKVIETNLTGPFWFALRAHQQMEAQESGGAIVNISSQASRGPGSPGLVAYGAAKAGLNHLSGSLAREWGPKIRVNCISLGHVVTEMHHKYILRGNDELRAQMERGVALRRLSEPHEVGDACIFLCSGEGDYINGTTIAFDGGLR